VRPPWRSAVGSSSASRLTPIAAISARSRSPVGRRREPLDYLRAAGFEIEHLSRSERGIVERVIARKPGPKTTAP
jgi:hypothetical protein